MKNWKKFPCVLFLLTLLISLLAGLSAPALVSQSASAAPMAQAATNVVISEFRTRGTNGASDEFIELYNPTNSSINIGSWEVKVLTGTGTEATRVTITSGKILLPGQYYLIANNTATTGYSDSVSPDQTYTTGTVDAGGIALFDNLGTKIDSVGLNTLYTTYTETSPLTDLSNFTPDANRSYERYLGSALDSCVDTGDNSTDFQLISPSNPQNSLTPPRVCGGDADLFITQSVDNPTPAVLSNVTFTITINNLGSGDARSVEVKDVLPTGLTYVSYLTSPVSSYSNATGIWNVGTLTNGSSATLTLVAKVATGGKKVNEAELWSSYDQDPNSTNNYASSTVTPPSSGFADLNITKTVNNPSPNVGDSVVFLVSVGNTGPAPATNVLVKDKLPVGMSYVSHTSGENYNPTTGEWIIGDVPVGVVQVLRITAKVDTTDEKINWAEVWSADQAPTGTDRHFGNSSYLTTPITDPPTHEPDEAYAKVTPVGGNTNLSLKLTDEKVNPGVAGNVVLTITVTNEGDYNATNIIVKDALPTGLTYVSDTGGGSYNKTSGFWSVGAIDSKDDKVLNITVKVDPTGTLKNDAEIWSADQAPTDSRVYGNGSTTEDDDASVIIESADLSVTKSMDNVTPLLNTDVVFTIRVSNAGPNPATGVKVKDLLTPTEYLYLSDDAGTCATPVAVPCYTSSSGIWDVGDLAIYQTKILKITATVKKVPLVTNWVEVFASDQIDIDSVPGNNSKDSDDDASAPSADLRLEQAVKQKVNQDWVSTNYPGLNKPFTYRITVSNDGTINATGVIVKAKLPSGVTWISDNSIATGTSYVPSTGYWTVGTLVNGDSKELIVTAQLPSTFFGIRTNWAEVWTVSPKYDPDSTPGNSSTTEDDDASATVYFRPILINEVAWSGTAASTDDQWIELYNPNSVAVNISGWVLKNYEDTFSVTLNGSIAAGSFFLLERDTNLTVSDVTANQIYMGALDPSGETLILCASDTTSAPCTVALPNPTNVIDTANYAGYSNKSNPWPDGKISATYPASMERVGNTAESDSVWVTNTGVTKNGKNASGGAIYGTPGKKNSTGIAPTPTPITIRPTAVPIVRPVINEFLARPGYDWNQDGKVDVFDEFIEIKNIGIIDVNLNGWQLDDEEGSGSAPFKIPAAILKPGQRAIFYGLQTNILLGDGGDTVRLINPNGKIYDAYTYALVRLEDQSVCRLPDGGSGWYEDCVPTPNLTNTREGTVPSMPGGEVFESPTCELPDTLPADFLFAECRGYGADVWRSFYWDKLGWQGDQPIPENMSKWESFVE